MHESLRPESRTLKHRCNRSWTRRPLSVDCNMTISTQDPEFRYTDRQSAGIVSSTLYTVNVSLKVRGSSRTLTEQVETRRPPQGPQTCAFVSPLSLLFCFLACWWAVRRFCVLSCRLCLARLRWLPSFLFLCDGRRPKTWLSLSGIPLADTAGVVFVANMDSLRAHFSSRHARCDWSILLYEPP